jgi:hypothetical protein
VKQGLIQNLNRYRFSLTTTGLTINGVLMSDEIFQQFKAKYIKGPRDHFNYSQYYTSRGSGSHCDVHTPTSDWNIVYTY